MNKKFKTGTELRFFLLLFLLILPGVDGQSTASLPIGINCNVKSLYRLVKKDMLPLAGNVLMNLEFREDKKSRKRKYFYSKATIDYHNGDFESAYKSIQAAAENKSRWIKRRNMELMKLESDILQGMLELVQHENESLTSRMDEIGMAPASAQKSTEPLKKISKKWKSWNQELIIDLELSPKDLNPTLDDRKNALRSFDSFYDKVKQRFPELLNTVTMDLLHDSIFTVSIPCVGNWKQNIDEVAALSLSLIDNLLYADKMKIDRFFVKGSKTDALRYTVRSYDGSVGIIRAKHCVVNSQDKYFTIPARVPMSQMEAFYVDMLQVLRIYELTLPKRIKNHMEIFYNQESSTDLINIHVYLTKI